MHGTAHPFLHLHKHVQTVHDELSCNNIEEPLCGVPAPAQSSSFKPWLAVLPRTFDTPLHFSDSELKELQGTTLYSATQYVPVRNVKRMVLLVSERPLKR